MIKVGVIWELMMREKWGNSICCIKVFTQVNYAQFGSKSSFTPIFPPFLSHGQINTSVNQQIFEVKISF